MAGVVAGAFHKDVARRATASFSPGPGGPKLLDRLRQAMRSVQELLGHKDVKTTMNLYACPLARSVGCSPPCGRALRKRFL